MNNMIIYLISDTFETLYFEDKKCALFYTNHIDTSYSMFKIHIEYDKYEHSNMIITINEFIDHIEKNYLDHDDIESSMNRDFMIIKKTKIREEILNKLLND